MASAPIFLEQLDAGAEERERGHLEACAEQPHPAERQRHTPIGGRGTLGHESYITTRSHLWACGVVSHVTSGVTPFFWPRYAGTFHLVGTRLPFVPLSRVCAG